MLFPSFDDDFSVLKCFFSCCLFLLNNMRCCAFIGFNLRGLRFFQRLCLGFFKISLGLMAGVWIDGFFLVIMTFLSFFNGYLLV